MSPCTLVQPVAPQLLPPAHLVILSRPQVQVPPQPSYQSQPPTYLPHVQQLVPKLTSAAPSTPASYASAPAPQALPMVLRAASSSSNPELAVSSQASSARSQATQSSARSSAGLLVAPNMANKARSEQAVIQALQAVAKYPESRDFVESMTSNLPGCKYCCLSTRTNQDPRPKAATERALSPISMLSPNSDEEPGRKTGSPHELCGAASTNDSPTSHPPLDKRNNVPRSLVIPEPPKVGYKGVPETQMSMNDELERYPPSPSSVLEGTVTTASSSCLRCRRNIHCQRM